jgi:virginiamycin B lyase
MNRAVVLINTLFLTNCVNFGKKGNPSDGSAVAMAPPQSNQMSNFETLPASEVSQRLQFFSLPPSRSTHEMSFGPDGSLWITQQENDRVLYFSEPKTGSYRVLEQPKGSWPHSVVADCSGAWVVWQQKDAIVHMNSRGLIDKTFRLPEAPDPHGLTKDRKGRLWFASKVSSKVGWLDPTTGVRKIFNLRKGSVPIYLYADTAGSVWFTELEGSRIGRIRDEILVELDIPTPKARPITIEEAPDHSIWFTEEAGNKLGYISPAAALGNLSGGSVVIKEISTPFSEGTLAGHHILKDGSIWFQHNDDDALVRYRRGQFLIVPLGSKGSRQHRVVQGPDGNLWFTELSSDRLGVFKL